MVTIDVGSVYITNSKDVTTTDISGNGKTVKIRTTKLDQNYDNPVLLIPIPLSFGNRKDAEDNEDGGKEPFARAIDLKRINEAITVQGFLVDEVSESSITKKNNLLILGKNKGALTLVWGQVPYQTVWKPDKDPEVNLGVFINKITFTETVGIVGDTVNINAQPERNIAVQFQVVRGKDLANP